MGSRGPRAEPTELKLLKGNPGKRPINKAEPKPTEFSELPKTPSHFDVLAKKEWNRLAPDLIRLGLLTVADLALFEAYCLCHSRLVTATKDLKKHKSLTYQYTNKAGATNITVRPEVAIIQKESIILKTLAAEFGCTPSARSRMNAPDILPPVGGGGQSGKGGFSGYLGGQRRKDLSSI